MENKLRIPLHFARTMLALLLAFGLGVARAEPVVTVDTRYYDLRGATVQELLQQKKALGPIGKDGKRYGANTKWHVAWRYAYRNEGGRCRIDQVTTSADIVFTLPRWNPPHRAASNLRARWDRYVFALQEHENGHRDFGISAAREVEREIAALPPRDNCRKMGEHANVTGRRVLDKYRALEIRYDQDTRHGATQGAVFP